MAPLTDLLKKDNPWFRFTDCERSFQKIKKMFNTTAYNRPNYKLPFYVHTNASGTGLGAVLYQLEENQNECIIGFAGRSLSKAERKYSTIERECLGVEKFRPNSEGVKFRMVTDYHSLI